MAQSLQNALFIISEELTDTRGKCSELIGILQYSRLVFEAGILARRKLRIFNLTRHMTQIISATLCIRSTRGELRDLASNPGTLGVRFANHISRRRRSTERVENHSLRICVEKCLCFVLAMEIH